jgi:Phosphopantothenoylcysteine synthetase/decarboxylase
MNIEEIRDYCLSKRCVSESFPFDEDNLVFKVIDKMFALVNLENPDYIILKCDSEYAVELREKYNGIEGAFHFNKKYWNRIYLRGDVNSELVTSLIDHSYEEVIKKFTRKKEKSMKGKHIVLGITGSIAAYKAAYLVRGLIKKGCEVQVIMTPSAKEFITPVTMSALTGKPVISEFFTANTGSWNSHVDLGLWADAVVIAPATASTIGKMANGIADNMLVTTYLSAKAPVFVAPAMDLDMFAHPSTQRNLQLLKSYGNHIIEPSSGELASHLIGKGRMEEPDKIIEILEEFLKEK